MPTATAAAAAPKEDDEAVYFAPELVEVVFSRDAATPWEAMVRSGTKIIESLIACF